MVFGKPGSEAFPRAGWGGAGGVAQDRLTMGQACSPALLWGPCLSHVLGRLACQGGTLGTGVAEVKQAGWPSDSDYLGLAA